MGAISLVDSLAVRNRPKQFSDIIGNTANIKTIHGFLGNGQLPRTWLMSGDPGAGKTTLARLLAMAVNCQNIGKSIKQGNIEPCLECTSCKLAMQNKHPDIFELNAGGEEGNVQSIRNLLDNMKLSPRFNIKCFILDECLPGDTQVLLEDGSTISLLEIYQNKDKTYNVLTFNTETNLTESNEVEDSIKRENREVIELELEDGTIQPCSANHKWWSVTRKQYIKAEDIQEDEELLFLSIQKQIIAKEIHVENRCTYHIKVKKIIKRNATQDLYDISVKNNHNFFVKIGDNKYILSSNCHALSASAKNNLLKPLEEPPSHVLWALCTTDPDKLPKATLTRCVKLYMEYPTIIDTSKKLWKVAKSEYPKICKVIKPYIKTIAQNTNGQMRDSYSVLESVAAIVSADPKISEDEMNKQFASVLANLGELTTPSIRFITHMMLNKFSLPLDIINQLDQSRLSEFLSVVSRHAHYASMYLSYKKDDQLKELNRKRFYGINFMRFDNAIEQVYQKLEKKGLTANQIFARCVNICSSNLEAINKNRMGLLSPEQSILCGISSYMQTQITQRD
jgi:DNA polymerase III gamma/tau subunit